MKNTYPKYRTLSEIAKAFDIEDGKDISGETIRRELWSRIKQVHPDPAGGKFRDQASETSFFRLTEALQVLAMLDSDSSTEALASLQPTALLPLPPDPLTFRDRHSAPNSLQPRVQVEPVADSQRRIKAHYALPKWSAAIFFAIAAACFSFPKVIREAPSVRELIISYSALELRIENRQRSELEDAASKFNNIADKLRSLATEELSSRGLATYIGGTDQIRTKAIAKEDGTLSAALRLLRALAYRRYARNADDRSIESRIQAVLPGAISSLSQGISQAIKEEGGRRGTDDFVESATRCQQELEDIAEELKAVPDQTAAARKMLIESADLQIARISFFFGGFSGLLFVLFWLRERSDMTWVDYLSSERGTREMYSLLLEQPEVIARSPTSFSEGELSLVLSRKRVPRLGAPFLGSTIAIQDVEKLGQLILAKLVERKVVQEFGNGSVEGWFEVLDNRAQRPRPIET